MPSPVVIERFPGLDMRTDPGESKGALDTSNIVIEPGAVRTRHGYATWFTPASLPVFLGRLQRISGDHMIVGAQGTPGTLYAVDQAGATVSSVSLNISIFGCSGQAIGTPSGTFYYVAPQASVGIRRWSGAAWTAPAGMPIASVLGISETDNRLVAGDGSKVSFSDPGAPETWGANNYVYVTPGDGEMIESIVSYNNQMFVFKRTKFFVFYGNSTDSTGNPVFNYRVVKTGSMLYTTGGPSPQSVCAGADGVYFTCNDGIYKTTGGAPVKVSQMLQRFYDGYTGHLSPFSLLGAWNPSQQGAHHMVWHDGKLYVSVHTFNGTASSAILVFDPALDVWYVWNIRVGSLISFPGTSTPYAADSLYLGLNNTAAVALLDAPITTDNGAAIVSRYRMPFESYGTPTRKRIRETLLEGYGTPRLQWSKDWGSLEAGGLVSLGTEPAYGTGRRRYSTRGRYFSLQLGAASGAWMVNRIEPILLDTAAPARIK